MLGQVVSKFASQRSPRFAPEHPSWTLGLKCWPVEVPSSGGDQFERSGLPTLLCPLLRLPAPGRSSGAAAQAGAGFAVLRFAVLRFAVLRFAVLRFAACFLGSGSLLNRCTLSFAPFRVGVVGCLNSFSSPEFPEASPCAARTLGGLKHRLVSALLAAASVHSLFLVGSLIQTSG
ncbi:unnamed protein product [Coccothraustes coccothraustes]